MPLPSPRNMLTSLPHWFATAMSENPSRSKSPMANARGPLPALTDTGVAKFPRLPEAKRMLSVPEHRSNDEEAQARSPFASKSLVSYSVIMDFRILSWIMLALLAGALTSASAQGKWTSGTPASISQPKQIEMCMIWTGKASTEANGASNSIIGRGPIRGSIRRAC